MSAQKRQDGRSVDVTLGVIAYNTPETAGLFACEAKLRRG